MLLYDSRVSGNFYLAEGTPFPGFDLESFPAIGAWLPRVAEQPGHVPIDA